MKIFCVLVPFLDVIRAAADVRPEHLQLPINDAIVALKHLRKSEGSPEEILRNRQQRRPLISILCC